MEVYEHNMHTHISQNFIHRRATIEVFSKLEIVQNIFSLLVTGQSSYPA